jgi:PPOX class probable FMN-dependent enzyme
MAGITSETDLRALHAPASDRALRKQLDHLDAHCRRFIDLSPFVVMATANADGRLDATPRGGDPGFVAVADERTLLLPDRPGNNRLDSLTNLTEHPEIGLLFMIPGVDETLRVNGAVELCTDAELVEPFRVGRRAPAVVLRITYGRPTCTARRRSCARACGTRAHRSSEPSCPPWGRCSATRSAPDGWNRRPRW